MPRKITEYRCLLISPGDVNDEREAISDLVIGWNAQIGVGLNARVELVRWESHSTPEMGEEPQAILNEQIVADSDLGIALFRARLGTPTSEYESGSVEEIYRLVEKGKRVLVYFSNAPIPQEALRDDQFSALKEVRERLQKEGLLSTYNDVSDLREKVQLHLTNVISSMLQQNPPPVAHDPRKVITAPRPDVRVSAYAAIVFDRGPFRSGDPQNLVAVRISNHSPHPFFLGGVSLTPKDKGEHHWLLLDDASSGAPVARRIESGQAQVISIDPGEVASKTNLAEVDTIVVSDEIGREYVVPHEEVQKAFEDVSKHRGSYGT